MASGRTTPTEPASTDGPTPGDGIPVAVDGADTPAPIDPAKPTEQDQTEAEQVAGAESVDLVLLQHWTDDKGKSYPPEATVTVDALTAVTLLNANWATKAKAKADTPA